MRQATALFLFTATLVACSAGSSVGFFDSGRLLNESTAAHAALDAPNQKLQRAQDGLRRAQDALARADETSAAARQADVDKANAALEEANRVRFAAGRALDDRIAVIVAKLSSQRRMSLVLGIGGKPPYAAPDADLTTPLIEALDGGATELAKARGAANAAVEKLRQLEAAEATGPPDAGRRK